jgi:hypothetical protein
LPRRETSPAEIVCFTDGRFRGVGGMRRHPAQVEERQMKSRTLTMKLAGTALAALFLSATASMAEMVKMTATLDGAQQSPAVTTDGKGSAELTFDTETKKLDWTIEYSGLSGPPAAGHFHGPADAGANAGVAVPFEGDLASPIKGSATLTDAQAADLTAGKYYINLHTAAHKGGEIRGQVTKAGM